MIDQRGFAEGSRYDRAKRERLTADRAKAIDPEEIADEVVQGQID